MTNSEEYSRNRGQGKVDWNKASQKVSIGHYRHLQYKAEAIRHGVRQNKEDGKWYTICDGKWATREYLGWRETIQCIYCLICLNAEERGDDKKH